MDAELQSLRIERGQRQPTRGEHRAARWIATGVLALILLGAGYAWSRRNTATEVQVARVRAGEAGGVVLNATGYVVAAHKIEVAAKVIGKVSWIGVEKGDRVRQGDVIVRLEDDEYRAQLQQARGQLANLEAKLAEALHGSRPEEIAQALANVQSAKADLENARINLERVRVLSGEGVVSRQALDDGQSRYDQAAARLVALQKTYELVKLGPRQEQVDSLRGQVEQARGAVAFAETNLSNTVIHAPVTGTILERAVEKGEFVTTSFVGDRGAKGYVVSLADLNDLEVELDISQNDFAKLHAAQRGVVTTDAFPDRKYEGYIKEISPEANRQKATVQVKVKIARPDEYLRPEMNASVAFRADGGAARPAPEVPAEAVRDHAVFVVTEGRAARRPVEGLRGGEDVIVNPPAGMKDGDRVRVKS